MKPLKRASSALLLGRLSVSGTRKFMMQTMNLTSVFNNVVITILENSVIRAKDFVFHPLRRHLI
ncbi:hypothetical protein YC2023_043876 [Brassica napus]